MSFVAHYEEMAPDRIEIDAMPGYVLLEFGVGWCPHCVGAQTYIESALKSISGLRHIKLEDGTGRRLGRTFRVKLWPTLILLRDGREISRVVRPSSAREVSELFAG